MAQRDTRQPSLFDKPRDSPNWSLADEMEEPPDEDFIQGVRDELNATLALARASTKFPWRDLTATYVVEMRFYSKSQWLPRREAVELRRAFATEMDRLYEAADEARPEVWGADF